MTSSDLGDLPAGPLGEWLDAMRAALSGERDADVPCAGCTACCRSAQFVHIAPDETDTLAHVPRELLFPAPFRPRGHVVMGFDDRGHCPMLVDDRCSIYEHRPRTCRTYDCRVFAATGVEVEAGKDALARRIARWRFDLADAGDSLRADALRAAAAFLDTHPELFPDGGPPGNPAQRAVLAVEVCELFLDFDAHGSPFVREPSRDAVRAELQRLLG